MVTQAKHNEHTTQNGFATVQYDKNGNLKWMQSFDGPAHEQDIANAMAVDAQDNIYITGQSQAPGIFNLDYATIKYNTKGELQWVQRFDGTANADDQPLSIALDANNNVYVTGGSRTETGPGGLFEFATVKYGIALSLNYSNAEVELQYHGEITKNGKLSLNLLIRDTNSNIIVTTSMEIDVTSRGYRLDINKPLEKEAKKLVKIIAQAQAVSIANALQELIVEYSSNHNVNDFKNEQLEGLFYYHAVFKAIDRFYSDLQTNDKVKIEITNYNGYIVGFNPYVAKEDIIVNVAVLITFLQNKGATQDDINSITNKLMGHSSISMRDYELLVNGFLSNTSTQKPFTGPCIIFCGGLQGSDCGCCGNYVGNCYYATNLCFWHDFLCQECDYWWCLWGCRRSSCDPFARKF